MHALFGHVNLVLPHSARQSVYLAVDIGKADAVVVEDVEFAHAATHKHFGHVAAHAANAKHRHATSFERVHGWFAKQQLGS